MARVIWFLCRTKWYLLLHTETLRLRIEQEHDDIPVIFSSMLAQNLDFGAGAMYLNQTRCGTEMTGKLYTFEALLRNHRHCEASDPRDMIYAFQGIARQESMPFTTHSHLMAPDYTISVTALYTRTARIMMQCSADLQFLAKKETKRVRKINSLPSWVPDYSVKLLPEPLVIRGPNCNWCADGNLTWKIDNRHISDPLLNVQGIFIGNVEARSDDPTDNEDWYGIWTSYCRVAQGLNPYYTLDPEAENNTDLSSMQTRVEVFWRTLVADTFHGEHPAPLECGEEFLAHVSSFVGKTWREDSMQKLPLRARLTSRIPPKEIRITPWIQLFESEPPTSRYGSQIFHEKFEETIDYILEHEKNSMVEASRMFANFRLECSLTLGARRLIRTTGGLLGMGPLETDVDDEVWILAGAKTPVVLRDVGGGKKGFLGEAYVHGVMHGEALDVGGEEIELVDIVLE